MSRKKSPCSHLEFDFKVVDIHHFILQKQEELWETENLPYAFETVVLGKRHRNEWRTSQQTEKAQRLSMKQKKNKATKSGFECWQGK